VRCSARSATPPRQHALVEYAPLDGIRDDLKATLPWLRVCRKRLVDVASSYENHPKLADLHRDKEMLRRLRRIHRELG
jgi:hypothetical protein